MFGVWFTLCSRQVPSTTELPRGIAVIITLRATCRAYSRFYLFVYYILCPLDHAVVDQLVHMRKNSWHVGMKVPKTKEASKTEYDGIQQ